MRLPVPDPRPRAAAALLVLALGTGLFAPTASAGTGTIADGKLDLLVYFAYPEADPASWEPVFEAYSRLLANATEGGLQLGTVSFTTCEGLADRADVWVLDDFSGARAHIGGLGRLGQHITISQVHRSTTGAALGQFGLTHESGHYVWGLYDEYRGFIGDLPAVSTFHYCSSQYGITACIMDGGTTVTPNNLRTEFCTDGALGFLATSHFTGVVDLQGRRIVTDQEYALGRSCWSQIQRSGKGGLVQPSTIPSDVDVATDPVVFDTARYLGDLGLALVLDTSGSMSADRRLEGAIRGADLALGLLRDGEYQAVVAFDDQPQVVVPAQKVTAGSRQKAMDAVDRLTAQGGTVAGAAVLAAVSQLDRVEACRELVVLLTDGRSDAPDVDDDTVLQALQSRDVALYAIALGSFPDDAALVDAAAATGGLYFHAESPDDLPGILAAIFAQAGGGTVVGTVRDGDLARGAVAAVGLDVPAGADVLRVAVAASTADPEVDLLAPDGGLVRSDAPPADVTVVRAQGVLVLHVPAPVEGSWRALVRSADGARTRYDLNAAVLARRLLVTATSDADHVLAPDPMRVEVSVVDGVPVADADVRALVARPDGTRVPLVLRDDGHPTSGDLQAGDGVYAALFSDYAGPGPYRFDVDVANVRGVAASNRECGSFGREGGATGAGGEEGSGSDPVPPFFARATRTLLLDEAGGPPEVGHAELVPHAAGRGEAVVAAFGLSASEDEPLVLEDVRLAARDASSARALAALGPIELCLDLDGDGRIDRPRRPLARATAVDGTLVFRRRGGDLAPLPAGAASGLLLVAVNAPAPGGAAGFGLDPRGAGPRRGAVRRLPGEALLVLVLVLLLVRRARPRTRLGLALAAAGLAVACSGAGSGPPATLELLPGDVQVRGAVTGASIPVEGPPLELRLQGE